MPITNLELDKLECMKNMYKGLPDVIDEKLKEIGALLLLIQWDNLVHKSSTGILFDFSSLVPADEDWSKTYLVYCVQWQKLNWVKKFRIMTTNLRQHQDC